MITTITDKNAQEHQYHEFTAFASDLGWPPGQVPRVLETTLGNKQPLVLQKVSEGVFNYRQQFGCILVNIFND